MAAEKTVPDQTARLKEANDIMASFLVGGLRIKADDNLDDGLDDLVAAVKKIMDATYGERRSAVMEYISSRNKDAFLASLLHIHDAIFYDAYGPYWLKHCKPVKDRDSEVEFTYYNDLIDMYWAANWQEWKRKGKWEVTIMLPPTRGLMDLQRRE